MLYPRFPFVDLGYLYASIIQNSPCKVLHNLHKNGIYLFTYAEGDLMKNFQKIEGKKEPCGSCFIYCIS